MTTGKILGEKYIMNGMASDVSGFVPDMSADIYYEVVRLIDRKLLFLDDHLERLRISLERSELSCPDPDLIKENLRLLLQYNNFSQGNIRICLQGNNHSGTDILCYYIPYNYPETCMYKSGVQLATFPHVRPNPGIKKWDDQFRTSVFEFIRDRGIYEVVLLNDLAQVTEGSRSNIFFFDKNDHLITPPEEGILQGITRKYILMLCEEEGIRVIRRVIPYDEIGLMPSCFITGTSPKVLPVWQLDGFQFEVDHQLLQLIIDRFESLLLEHLTTIL